MSFISKIKDILFDEEDIEVPVGSDELPERTSKKQQNNNTGFIDHHSTEEIDDSPIKEIKLPKEDDIQIEDEKKFNLQEEFKDNLDDDFFDNINIERKEEKTDFDKPIIPSRMGNYDDLELSFMDEKEEVKTQEVVSGYRVNEPTGTKRELKDYRKMLSAETEENVEKKPFKNTPVISPVWGILDKDYTPADIVDKTETLNQINCGSGERNYGPVSYNDQPLPHVNYKSTNKNETKEDLVTLNNTISEMVEEDIEVPEVKEKVIETTVKVETTEPAKVEVVIPTKVEEQEESNDDLVIQTDDYDEYEDVVEETPKHSIADVQESIEEEKEESDVVDDDTPEVDFETIVPKKIDLDDDEGLDNTIETDLFNLIDSMYKDEEEDE